MHGAVELMMGLAANVFEQGGKVRVHIASASFKCRRIEISSDRTALQCFGLDDAEVIIPASAVLAVEEIAASYD